MSEYSFDVVTMGSATQDVFVKTDAETIRLCQHNHCDTLLAYPLGQKILINHLDHQIGGGGTNTATTFARQGLKTGFIGKIGKDAAGLAVHKFLKEEQITFLGSVGKQTGYSVILDSENEDRTILVFKGTNNQLKYPEIEKTIKKLETKWLYCSSMLEHSYESMKTVMRIVKEKGGKIAFNPSSYQAKEGMDALWDTLGLLDVLILNKEEAQLLTKGKLEDPKKLLQILKSAVTGIVVITEGAKGVHVLADKYYYAPPAANLEIVETTGAGDAFASGFVAGLARNKSVRESLLTGMLNAEHVICHYGAKNEIPKKLKLDIFVSQDKREIVEE